MAEEVLIERASDGAATNGTHVLAASTDYTLAAENHERDELIVSTSVTDAWVSLGTAAAVVGSGIKIAAGGPAEHIQGWKGAVHIISSGTPTIGFAETSFHSGDDEGEEQPGEAAFVPSGPSDDYFLRAVVTAPPPGTPYPPNA